MMMPIKTKQEALDYINAWAEEPDARAAQFFAALLDGMYMHAVFEDITEALEVIEEAYFGCTGTYLSTR